MLAYVTERRPGITTLGGPCVTLVCWVLQHHPDIGYTEVRPLAKFCHYEGSPRLGRRLPIAMERDETYGPLRTRIEAFPTEQLIPVFGD